MKGDGKKMAGARKAPTRAATGGSAATPKPRCGLCGKTAKLVRTDCCAQWICDDEDKYVLFSYARNSCHRNHRRFTLCGYHSAESHPGHWKECPACREAFETEIYVYYGTNEYNFGKLENPPAYEPRRCSKCATVIVLSEGGYSMQGKEYWCERCSGAEMGRLLGGGGRRGGREGSRS